MKKRNLFIILSLICFSLLSQNYNVELGSENELEDDFYVHQILGFDQDGFYALKSDDTQLKNSDIYKIDYVSNLTYEKQSSSEMTLPVIKGEYSIFEKLFFIKGKLILFTSIADNLSEKKYLYVQYVNKNGTIKNKPKKIGAIPLSNRPEDGFRIIRSEHSDYILIHYHNSFAKYNGEKLYFKIFDSNLQEKFSNYIVPETFKERDYVRFKKIDLGESGNIYFHTELAKISKRKSRRRSVESQAENVIFCYNTEEEELKHYSISLKKYIPASSTFALDQDENIFVFGYLTKSRRKDLEGIYYQKIDPRIQKFKFPIASKTIYETFDKDQEMEFKSKRSMKTEGNSYSFYPVDICFLSTGDVMFISEQKYLYEKKYVNPKNKQEVVIRNNFYKDLYLALGDANGKMKWLNRVYKDQVGIENDGFYSSIKIFNEGNNLRIFYNDHKANFKDRPADKIKQLKNIEGKNPKGLSVVLSVFNDGQPMKDKLFTGDYKKQVLIPSSIKKNDGRYYFCSQSKDKYRYGMMYIE